MKNTIKVGKIRGIEIGIHYSWFFIFALLAYSLSTGYFPTSFPAYSKINYWTMGIISSILLFVSVLFHELSHSIVALRNGIKVDKINLFFFGGVASIDEKNITPKIELKTAIAGPIFSMFLGALFFAIFYYSPISYITAVASYLYKINFILAFFNLAPGFPLDGGRVFRALIWGWTGDVERATRYAAAWGKGFAFLLMTIGFMGIFFFGQFGGVWFILLGLFLLFLADASYQQILIKKTLAGVSVREIMKKDFNKVDADSSISKVIKDSFLTHEQESFIVTKGKEFLGIIDLERIKTVPKQLWTKVKVKTVMIPAKKVKKISAKTDAYSALVTILNKKLALMPVIENKKLVGVIERDSLLYYLRLRTELSGTFNIL
jgi:Zn-dependent protease